jgi:predicted nucleotidyltransferase component of viral defense system
MLKEYVQLLVLDFLSTSAYVRQIVFIGGTNLRLVKGIDRFSEDLDFDCKNLSSEEFLQMTDEVLLFLQRAGFQVEPRDKPNDRLKAFRRNIYFPQLLFDLGLSGYKEERFLIKIESQNQGYDYASVVVNIKRAGFFFPFPVPPDDILCAMKISALLSRQKGRDFYDALFLLGQTEPDYGYLSAKCNVHHREELKIALTEALNKVNIQQKSHDFEHLLFDKSQIRKVLIFRDFVDAL